MDPINIPPMLAYIPYMDPMGICIYIESLENVWTSLSLKKNPVHGWEIPKKNMEIRKKLGT